MTLSLPQQLELRKNSFCFNWHPDRFYEKENIIYPVYQRKHESWRWYQQRFDAGETLTVTSDNSDRNGDKFLVNTQTSRQVLPIIFMQVIDFTIQEGVIFAQGKLVKHDKQTIRLDPYSARVSYLVGVTLKETIKTSDDDATLLDPATGTYNYNAPGADRTELTTVLTKVPFGEEYQNNRHYDIGMHIENGGNIYEVTTAEHTFHRICLLIICRCCTDGSVGFTYLKPPTNFTSVYKIKNGVLQRRWITV